MKTTILLFCLLGSTLSLPMQLNPTLGLPPAKLVPDQATPLNQQQPNPVFPSLSLIPLTQMLTLGSDLQLILPVIVAHLGVQGTILSSEELPAAPQIFTGLIFHPLFPGAIQPTSQANPDVQNGILPAAQAGVNSANQGTPRGPLPTPSGTDDDFVVTTPAGIQRGTHTMEETTTPSPNGKFSKPLMCPWAMKVICKVEGEFLP
ncbi:Amelotin [Camelus dromedarius]|uniref:Amelotin n=1 Tax=Camelus dromedarius TaxID=9838 RepID=A0A5N4EHB2_CAMDR|nr:Amelotin [Camelus dromedarius]